MVKKVTKEEKVTWEKNFSGWFVGLSVCRSRDK